MRHSRQAVVLVVTAMVLGVLSLAMSGPASAYSGSCTAQVTPPVVHSGDTIAVTGSATPPVETPNAVNTWTVNFNGAVQQFTGNSLNTTYVAPTVNQGQVFVFTVTCTDSAGTSLVFDITVDPALAHGVLPSTGHLPNTGGPSLWWLLLALLAIATGTALIVRRREQAEAAAGVHRL